MAEEDRISSLPDHLLLEIISRIKIMDKEKEEERLMSTKEVIKTTATISKRWSHLWTRLPTLVFVREDVIKHSCYSLKDVANYFLFIDKTLTQYPTDVNLKKLKLQILDVRKPTKMMRVNSWLRYAITRNVQEIDLEMADMFSYQSCDDELFFNNSCLISMNLSRCTFNPPNGAIRWDKLKYLCIDQADLDEDSIGPTSMKLSRSLFNPPNGAIHCDKLKFLCIDGGKLDKDSIGKILSRCPCLETLQLRYCCGFRQIDVTSKSAACSEARNLIFDLTSERDRLAFEVSTLHSAFRDFKEMMEAQQEAQAQALYNRVAELEAHVMDVSGRLEGEFYPAYLTALAGRRWLLTHGVGLAMVKCLKSLEYQGILGHALGQAVDFGMQEGLAAGHKHGVAGTPLSAVMAYGPEAAEAKYLDAIKALKEADFPLVQLLKSKKDFGVDELSIPIYHTDVNAIVRETSLSFALLNVHTRTEGAKKHATALRQLIVDIVSHPLSSQTLVGEASTSATTLSVEDLDTDEELGSVVYMPYFKDLRCEILP
ncbi:ribonuclease H-like domain-containing protein [Tanacetum coccineum]